MVDTWPLTQTFVITHTDVLTAFCEILSGFYSIIWTSKLFTAKKYWKSEGKAGTNCVSDFFFSVLPATSGVVEAAESELHCVWRKHWFRWRSATNLTYISLTRHLLKSRSFAFWRRVELWKDNNVSEVHAASIFTSPWRRRRRQHGPLKLWYPTAAQHSHPGRPLLESSLSWKPQT
jgi:hypothetical protein